MSALVISEDTLLLWIKARVAGINSVEIAKEFGVKPEYVRAATNRVVKDDAKHHSDKIVFMKRDYTK